MEDSIENMSHLSDNNQGCDQNLHVLMHDEDEQTESFYIRVVEIFA